MKKRDKKQLMEIEGTEGVAKKKKKRKKAPVIIAIVVIVFIVIQVASCALMPEAGAVVTTTTAFRGDLQESISTSGTVSGEEQKVLFAPVGGRLAEVYVAAGDAVKTGDMLISYDMEEAEDRMQQAALQQTKSTASYQSAMANSSESQAKLNEANHNLGVLNEQIKNQKAYLTDLQNELSDSLRGTNNALANQSYELNSQSTELQRQLALLDKNAADYVTRYADLQKQLQDVNLQLAQTQLLQSTASNSDYVAEMELKIAEAQEQLAGFEKYKAEMETQKASNENTVLDSYGKQQYSADKELASMTYEAAEEDYYTAKQGIVAEFDGIVTACTAVQGSTVTDGMQLLTLESSNDVKVSFNASKSDVEKLAIGQKAAITISGNSYEGEVSKINRMATLSASNTPMVGVEVHISNPDDRIILGLDAKLTVYTNKAEGALLIPVEVINADKDGDFLYVVENNVVVRKPITCGISSDTYTEVLEGITEEDEIIVTSYTALEEGMAVTVMEEELMQQLEGSTDSALSVSVTTE